MTGQPPTGEYTSSSLVMMSLASLARLAREADLTKAVSQAPQVIRLREAETTPAASALVLVHPVGGSVLPYRDLVPYLAPNRSVYAIQSRPNDERTSLDHASLEALAADYIRQIRYCEPAGSLVLGGYCLGGAVAFEMARQLRGSDNPVDEVIIIDTAARVRPAEQSDGDPVSTSQLLGFANMLAAMSRTQLSLDPQELEAVPAGERVQRVVGRLRDLRIMPASCDDELFRAVYRLIHHNELLQRGYTPGTYDGSVCVIRTTTKEQLFYEETKDVYDDPAFGWERFCTRPVDVRRVAGGHFQLLYQPFIRGLGLSIESVLTKAPAA
jgi:thioesterase domain-containing protein